MKSSANLCNVHIIPKGKRYRLKIGEDLSEKSTKKEFFNKLKQISNFIMLGHFSLETVFLEDLPLFPKYEKEVLKNPFFSFIYSFFFLKSRWRSGEVVIKKDPVAFFLYLSCLNSRAEDLEEYITTNPQLIYNYCKRVFRRKDIPAEIHNVMLGYAIKDSSNSYVKKYFRMKKLSKAY
jgi:hypothetical protein